MLEPTGLYHIQRYWDGFLGNEEGDILDTNSWKENEFQLSIARGFNRAHNDIVKYIGEDDPRKHLDQGSLDDLFLEKGRDFIIEKAKRYREIAWQLAGRSDQQLKIVRETIFEQVRRELFVELPSRKRCIWVTEGKHVPQWLATFAKQTRISGTKIFKVTLLDTHAKHNGDPYSIKDNFLYENIWSLAVNYWTGELSNPNVYEILFEGKLKLEKRVV